MSVMFWIFFPVLICFVFNFSIEAKSKTRKRTMNSIDFIFHLICVFFSSVIIRTQFDSHTTLNMWIWYDANGLERHCQWVYNMKYAERNSYRLKLDALFVPSNAAHHNLNDLSTHLRAHLLIAPSHNRNFRCRWIVVDSIHCRNLSHWYRMHQCLVHNIRSSESGCEGGTNRRNSNSKLNVDTFRWHPMNLQDNYCCSLGIPS